MSGFFCGNPFNHDSHYVEDKSSWCDGVGRVAVEDAVVVEKFVPEMSDMAEDGTEYYKMTVLIEDEHGNVSIVNLPKVSYPRFLPYYQEHIDLEKESLAPNPQLVESSIIFTPHGTDEAPAWKIERVMNNDA